MAWTDPRTWVSGELVDQVILNAHIRDNLNALKDSPTDVFEGDNGGDYSLSSATSFADIDSTNLSVSITTTGGDVLIGGHLVISQSGAGQGYLDITDNGVSITGVSNGLGIAVDTSQRNYISFTILRESPTAGVHTYNLQWKNTAGITSIEAGATDWLQFWVKEI